jgi:SAM-dependent methyltransferase
MSNPDRPALTDAYSLNGPDACLRLYADWAESYDQSFAASMEYRLPAHVAAAWLASGTPPGPVLDVGAGTGLCAGALRDQGFSGPIDGVDLSPQMLQAARAKGIYRTLYCADIAAPLNLPSGYAGIVSSGTFTSGHVGPEALPHLIALAAPGAVLALSVNLRIWDCQGFDAALQALGPAIGPAQMLDVPIYGKAAATLDPDHALDRARIVILRRL